MNPLISHIAFSKIIRENVKIEGLHTLPALAVYARSVFVCEREPSGKATPSRFFFFPKSMEEQLPPSRRRPIRYGSLEREEVTSSKTGLLRSFVHARVRVAARKRGEKKVRASSNGGPSRIRKRVGGGKAPPLVECWRRRDNGFAKRRQYRKRRREWGIVGEARSWQWKQSEPRRGNVRRSESPVVCQADCDAAGSERNGCMKRGTRGQNGVSDG